MKNNTFLQRGQTGVVVLFIAVILVTIGLSIASRSVSDIKFSKQEEETTRAYNVAEAGIEDTLRSDLATLIPASDTCGTRTITIDDVDANIDVCAQQTLSTDLYENETVEVNLSGFGVGQGIKIEWGDSADENSCAVGSGDSISAIVVAFIDTHNGTLRRKAYDFCAASRVNSFSTAYTGLVDFKSQIDDSGGNTFMRKDSNNETKMRVRVLYGPQTSPVSKIPIRISGVSNPLPVQYYSVKSEARASGGETRAVEVTKTLPAFPSIFDFAIFTNSGITK